MMTTQSKLNGVAAFSNANIWVRLRKFTYFIGSCLNKKTYIYICWPVGAGSTVGFPW